MGLGLPCKWCPPAPQSPFPTISSSTKGRGGRRETGSLSFQLTCRCSHGSSDKYRLGTLLCGPRGDGRTPGKGCLPGVGAETWPGWPAAPPTPLHQLGRKRPDLRVPLESPHVPQSHSFPIVTCPRPRPVLRCPLYMLHQAPQEPGAVGRPSYWTVMSMTP